MCYYCNFCVSHTISTDIVISCLSAGVWYRQEHTAVRRGKYELCDMDADVSEGDDGQHSHQYWSAASHYRFLLASFSGGARVFAAPGQTSLLPPPAPAVRSPIVILIVTTMVLVSTVNSALSWGVKFQNSIFLALQMPPPAQCHPGPMPAFAPFPPLHSAINIAADDGNIHAKISQSLSCHCVAW